MTGILTSPSGRHRWLDFPSMAGAYFLGVFNDNFYKQAVLMLAVAAGHNAMQGYALAVFTLPFVLLAAPAGWPPFCSRFQALRPAPP